MVAQGWASMGPTIMIITLCGSSRFESLFKVWNQALTLAGHTVFTLSAYPSDHAGVKTWYTEAEKQLLDAAHLRKINASDAIFVINRFAYIGESTMGEIDHAKARNRKIFFLESWGLGLGVSNYHRDGVRQAMVKIGLPDHSQSPIDTTTRVSGHVDPWASNLMGPAGELRAKLVNLIHSAEAD